MLGRTVNGPERAPRSWSLRREWSRAFAILLLLLLTAALATILGMRTVVGDVRDTAEQLQRESATVAALRTAVVDHAQTAQQLLNHDAVDRVAFVREQEEIVRAFDAAATVFPADDGTRDKLLVARNSWQAGLTDYGLWGDQVSAMQGNHSAEIRFFGASSEATQALIDGLEGPSLQEMERGLARGAALERWTVVGLCAIFGVALAVTGYFRSRMARDLARPVADLHAGVLNLKAGRYDSPIVVSRRDELGELAEAFNDMAAALDQHHRALTLRATHDALTGLANRVTLTERLTASFGVGRERRAQQESLLFIDIDDFKNVNDSLGHEGGDALLVQLAARLSASVRPYDLVVRLGGDEFAIVVLEDGGGCTAAEVAERILAALATPFVIDGTRLHVAVSIGVARRRPETADAAELLRQADFAMYMAKGAGKNRYQLFDAQMHDDMVGATSLKADLALAVEADQLFLEYQPVVDLHTGVIVGVEALVRWRHPTLGVLSPADFVALAEETGDIEAIGCWVLRTAATDAAGWRRDVAGCSDVWMSLNLSAHQLPDRHSLAAVEGILADPAAEADRIVVEITEAAVASDVEAGVTALNTLKGFGVRIAIDDFGTGLSSLSTLTRLPADIVKIDHSFVSGTGTGGPSVPMLEGILGLGEKLSLDLVAEGIESPEQLELLRALGYRTGQGYFLARPASVEALRHLLRRGPLPHVVAEVAGAEP